MGRRLSRSHVSRHARRNEEAWSCVVTAFGSGQGALGTSKRLHARHLPESSTAHRPCHVGPCTCRLLPDLMRPLQLLQVAGTGAEVWSSSTPGWRSGKLALMGAVRCLPIMADAAR